MTTWDEQSVAVLRGLAMDGPRAANSGHPGTAMALAPLGHVLFSRVLKHDPRDPAWFDRDRFILSVGHVSMLLYSLLHLSGYEVSLEDLRDFRQVGSRTPGHPEAGHTPGVEVTTGPLGQGFANAVGQAVAERMLRSRYGAELVDHRIYTVLGDGCLEEGVSHEAASLAGHLGLGRLIAVYDDNAITIDGGTDLSLSDDTAARFRAYGWQVIELGEAMNDLDAIEAALREAAADERRPSLIILKTHIGWPTPSKVDTSDAHGAPFSLEEITETKGMLGLPDEPFFVPVEVRAGYDERLAAMHEASVSWRANAASSAKGAALLEVVADPWSPARSATLPAYEVGSSVATRKAVGDAVAASIGEQVPAIIGSADLTANVGLLIPGEPAQSPAHPEGRQLYYGVREHAMGAAMVGMALHGGVKAIGGTFFVFSDYMRPSIRMAALSGAPASFIFSHDSIGVGEDGPTHQPVEHLAALRAMPGLAVVRPSDANECVALWNDVLGAERATVLVTSRQNLPVLAETTTPAFGSANRGAYVLRDGGSFPELTLVGTGSEVQLAVEAAELLEAEGTATRVVAMPCMEWFELQEASYRDQVLPPELPTVSVEAGVGFGWQRFSDLHVGVERFGISGPGPEVYTELGVTAANVHAAARALLSAVEED